MSPDLEPLMSNPEKEIPMFETIRHPLRRSSGDSRVRWFVLALLAGASALVAHAHVPTQTPGSGSTSPPNVTAPRIEATFVLDTTGSMSGLIEGAKQKIWTIASEMAAAQNRPDVRLGLIAYRDRGDAYVTRRFALGPDADALYAHLQGLEANGGGDGPESVNQALHEAVTRMEWSDDPDVYRVIFLVGDAPPHMDYADDVPYTESARLAAQKGIRINTIQCGASGSTATFFKEIASLARGEYAAIAQDGAMVAIHTPVDAELVRLNELLADTTLAYGAPEEQREIVDKVERARSAPAPAAASRLSYLSKRGGRLNSGRADLIDALASGEVDLDSVPEPELPAELQGLGRAAQQERIEQKAAERKDLQRRIDAAVAERDAYLADERARREAQGNGGGFDDRVLRTLKSQAEEAGIHY